MDRPIPRLLAVDDQDYNLRLLRRIFADSYDITCVNSGEEALSLINEQSFDVVLLDIMMPGIDGFTVLKILRDVPDTADLPVILVSAMTEDEHIANGLALGANDYIPKPFDAAVAEARVRTQVTLKRLTDERKEAISSLQATNDLKVRLMRMASHDLKGPLTNMKLVNFLLRETVADDPKALELLDMSDESIGLMTTLTQEFLESGIAHGDSIQLNTEPLSIASLLEPILRQYEPTAQQKDIELITTYHDGHLVDADPKRMSQVLSNLISNAIKYSPSGSTVRVETAKNTSKIRVSIIDQGQGIPEDERQLLFQPFSQLSTRPTGGEHSTGLGLWIVKELVTMHDGEVGVDCPPTGGSNFWVDLPLAAQA